MFTNLAKGSKRVHVGYISSVAGVETLDKLALQGTAGLDEIQSDLFAFSPPG